LNLHVKNTDKRRFVPVSFLEVFVSLFGERSRLDKRQKALLGGGCGLRRTGLELVFDVHRANGVLGHVSLLLRFGAARPVRLPAGRNVAGNRFVPSGVPVMFVISHQPPCAKSNCYP
jgi:hypothetical protein